MAVGETARLIASLELQDKFSRQAAGAERALDGLERKTSTLGRIGGQVNAGLASAATNLTRIGILGGGLLGVGIARGIASLRELEEVNVATRTVIESTGGAAGVNAAKIRALAEEYEALNATIDDKVIQSGENLLLTFTNITQKGFEPALEAALNVNQALGGGEEGLQGTIIQVGKALNDPIRGLTNLRRIGVAFSKDQERQIKLLVEQNDLYGAQRIILDELEKEFGGQFAAAGATATGKFAKLKDAVEDAQMAMATAFLPVLGKVADKLTTLLADPKVLAQISDFGEGLAAGFDQVVQFAGKVPWEQIGTSLQIAGAGAKILLDAFVSLPPWVQTAVITGWGLNKLTGGALGNIVGTLASGLIKGVLGITAGVVNINAAAVNGGVGGGVPGAAGGGIIRSLLGVTTAVGLGAILGNAIGKNLFFNPTIQPAVDFEREQFTRVAGSQDLGQINNGLSAVNSGLDDLKNADKQQVELAGQQVRLGFLANLLTGEQTAILEGQKQTLEQARAEIVAATGNASSASSAWSQKQLAAFAGLTAEQRNAASAARTGASATSQMVAGLSQAKQAITGRIVELGGVVRSSKTNLRVTNNVTVSVSVSDIQRRLTSARVATGTISEF